MCTRRWSLHTFSRRPQVRHDCAHRRRPSAHSGGLTEVEISRELWTRRRSWTALHFRNSTRSGEALGTYLSEFTVLYSCRFRTIPSPVPPVCSAAFATWTFSTGKAKNLSDFLSRRIKTGKWRGETGLIPMRVRPVAGRPGAGTDVRSPTQR
jgi:hypothetical protein